MVMYLILPKNLMQYNTEFVLVYNILVKTHR